MQPCGQGLAPLLGVLEGSGVGPFAERGLDEALGLAVGLRRVGFGSDVPDAELLAGARESFGLVAASVVGHDALDSDAEAFEVGDGGEEEGDCALLLLVGEDVGAGDAGVIVDRDVGELPAGALAAALAARDDR